MTSNPMTSTGPKGAVFIGVGSDRNEEVEKYRSRVTEVIERIVATSDAVETKAYYVETESFGEWIRLPTRYYSLGAAVAYARAFFPNWRIVEVSGV